MLKNFWICYLSEKSSPGSFFLYLQHCGMYWYEWRIPGIFCPVGWADPQLVPQEDGPASSGDQLEFQEGSDRQYYNFSVILDMQQYKI